MFEWNKAFQLVLKIKREYTEKFGLDTIKFEDWLEKLNNPEYNDIFSCLQVNQKDEFLLVRYGLQDMQEGLWEDPDSIYREFRSSVFDLVDEQIVLAAPRKFFNLNEVPENDIDIVAKEIEESDSTEISNKKDGSMQNGRYYKDRYFLAGSMALDPNDSWRLADGYSKLTEKHKRMEKENPKFTFSYEYISLRDAHVVCYKKADEGLFLFGMRNVYTGEELTYSEISEYAKKYDILMVEIEKRTFKEILELSKTLKASEKEGWVLMIGKRRIKLKCDDYVQLHRLLDKISSINVIIKNIADNTYDDLLSKVPTSHKDRVNKIAKIIYDYAKESNIKIHDYYEVAPKDTKKDFMIWVDSNVQKNLVMYVKMEYLGKEWNVLKTMYGQQAKYKRLNEMGLYDNYATLFADLEEI